MQKTVQIARRFQGPPESGNGGYSCGLFGRELSGPVEVTLKSPPPLEKDLRLVEEAGFLRLYYDDALVGEARSVDETALDVPPLPTPAEVQAASTRYVGFHSHGFPHCFVCGPRRAEGDGLRIFAGAHASQVYAAPWVPDASLEDEDGLVRKEFLWAALDCPGYFAAMGDEMRPALLGRMTAEVPGGIRPGERCTVLSWPISRKGRKHEVGTALFNEAGELCGKALGVWIEVELRSL